MWEPAGVVALSIFLTFTMFLTIYGMSYLLVVGTIKGARSINKNLKEKNNE
ncbi:hypothetical protein OAA09_01110 [bacterium]|nr:hypothetical protein [bacterium]